MRESSHSASVCSLRLLPLLAVPSLYALPWSSPVSACTLHTSAAWQIAVPIPPASGNAQRDLSIDIRSYDGPVLGPGDGPLRYSLTATLPTRPGRSASLHVEGPVEFDVQIRKLYVWTRQPVSSAQGLVQLPARAALVDAWSEGDTVIGTLVLEGPYGLSEDRQPPVETLFPVRVPCSSLTLFTHDTSELPIVEHPAPLPLQDDEEIPPGVWRTRKDSLRAFLRPAPRWDAPRSVLARWSRLHDNDGDAEFHFYFRQVREQGDWLFVDYGLEPSSIRISGWIHRSVLEPALDLDPGWYTEPDSGLGPGGWGAWDYDYVGPARVKVGTQLLHPISNRPWATVRKPDWFTVVVDSKRKFALIVGIPGILLRGNSVGVPWTAIEWPAPENPYEPRP